MNAYKYLLTALLVLVFGTTSLYAQEFPADYKGQVLAPGGKPAWLPDGQEISYSYDNGFYIYNLKKGKTQKITDINIAEYAWIDNNTALVIAWPDNIADKKSAQKIVSYWLIEKGGKKTLLAADTVATNHIPDYNKPFRLPDGTYGLRKNSGWKIKDYIQNEDFVAFTKADYDLEAALKNFRFVTWSNQEGGSIHLKNINTDTEKTLVPGNYHTDIRISDDYSKLLTYADESSYIIDSNGALLYNLRDYISPDLLSGFKKMFGGMWNHSNDGVAYFEIYELPEKYYTLNYFDLNTGQKTVLTPSYYFSKEGLFWAPDNSALLTYFVQDEISYIALIKLPLPALPAER